MLQRINANKLQLIALIVLALYPLAILAARLDIWHFRNSFLIFVLASLVGFALLVISILKLSKPVKDEKSETRPLLITIVATGLPLALMGKSIMAAQAHPFIHDITTDFQQPPAFMAAKTVRAESDHDVAYLAENIEFGFKKLSFLTSSYIFDDYKNIEIFTWHRDTFKLPSKAKLIARTSFHQIFTIKKTKSIQ